MRVGIVGCGAIAASHLPHVVGHRRVEAVAVADRDPAAAAAAAERFGLREVFGDLQALCRDFKPQVVHLLTPPATHAELAQAAMRQGCHVLVEKPMALSAGDAAAMIDTARECGVRLGVNHNFACGPLVDRARRLVARGATGRVVHVEAAYAFDLGRGAGLYRQDDPRGGWVRRMPGGLLADLLPHPLSLLAPFLGPEPQVTAVAVRRGMLPPPMPEELRVLLAGEGVTGALNLSVGIKPDTFTFTIFGTHMTLQVGLSNLFFVARRNRLLPKSLFRAVDNLDTAFQMLASTAVNTVKVLAGRMPPPGGVGPVIDAFYESLERGGPPPVSAEDGLAVVRLTERIWQAAGCGPAASGGDGAP